MLLGRKLLYHRGIDDSTGNYITNYLLFVECYIFVLYFIRLFVKSRGISKTQRGIGKSTYAIAALCAIVGTASFIAGLTHQFLQTIEPYKNWHDSKGWLIAWRVAAALSGAVSFVFLFLSEHMLSAEKLLQFKRIPFRIYYTFAVLVCIGITAHSFWLITAKDNPWTLTLTLSFTFGSALIELLVLGVVLMKRYRTDGTNSAFSNDTVALNTESTVESNSLTERKNKENILNNNPTPTPSRRTDLLLHFMACLLLIAGGVFQILMGSFGKCSQHRNSQSIGCPLPDEFNHNAVFHISQTIAIAIFFAAELSSIKHRRQKLLLERKSSEEENIVN